jgi:GntR family transcriptional regulator, transcriptional repressor for pyruvate dehydrogenase complex
MRVRAARGEMMARKARPARPKVDLVASRVAAGLREELLELPEGAFVGFEDELLAKFQVSRPTLRQAARVLENEQMLEVRRGVGGGYYARRPSIDVVGRTAAIFLRSRRTTLRQMLQTSAGLTRAIVASAAMSANDAARADLQRIVDEIGALRTETLAPADFYVAETRLAMGLAALADNPTLELFTAVLYQVGLRETRMRLFRDRPHRIAAHMKARLGVVEAVLKGDVEVAELLAARWSAQLMQWVDEDTRERGKAAGRLGGADEEWT